MVEQLDALVVGGDEALQARLHHLVPHFGIVAIRKAVRAADDPLQQRLQFWFTLLLGVRGAGEQRDRDREQCRAGQACAVPLSRHCVHYRSAFLSTWLMASPMGMSTAAASRRWRYSRWPAFRPRSPMTRRCGMPSNSESANLTPGRASRSSSTTSIPAAPNSPYRRSAT